MLSGAGWIMVQIAVVPFVVVAGVAVLWWRHRDERHRDATPC
jgi:hypothetical protein